MTEKQTKPRYVIEEADVALPWQSFYRIYDNQAEEVFIESNDRDKLKRIVHALNEK